MIRTGRYIRLFALFIAAIAVSFGLGALFPQLRESVAKTAGIGSRDGKKVAAATNTCTPEQTDDDDIYFLSCGGIY